MNGIDPTSHCAALSAMARSDVAASAAQIPQLPAPALGIDGNQDALARIFALLAAFQRSQTEAAKNEATSNSGMRQHLQRKHDQELAKAKAEAEEGGLFNWISQDIGLIGLAGLATFNYGLVAADLALHKSGLVENLKLDVLDAGAVALGRPEIIAADVLLRKLDVAPKKIEKKLDELGLGRSVPGISDDDVKPVIDKAIAANLMIAGATVSILSAGTTTAVVIACIGVALSAGGMASQWAGGPEWLSIGLQVAGAGCSIGSGFIGTAKAGVAKAAAASSSAATTGTTTTAVAQKAQMGARLASAKTAAQVVNGASAALKGADTVVAAVHADASDKATERATAARHALTRLERLFDGIIDSLKESQESYQRTAQTIQGTLQTHNQTLVLASSSLRG